ncbi:MAG: hypothetical protein IT369_10910 [Candidatus Latescibacteria bacterium]|nr:hypothetical protein [Candidatus Latescibacterota bacterium]
MQVLDYTRSFVTFVTKGRGNNARLQVESQCTLTAGGHTANYLFFASCKSENTFAPRDLFHADNYDFCGIFSEAEYAIFRTKSTHHAGWKEQGLWADRFENVHPHLVRVEGRELATPAEMVRASLNNVPLVGRVEIAAPDQAASAVLEFPIKTMNANDIETIYQVDTGPLAFPDFSLPAQRQIERLLPAYVAYNAPDFADFIVQQPLAVAGGAQVTHYSKLLSLPARTAVLALS